MGNHTAKVAQSELRHNVELACTPIYSGSATPNEHRVAIHCATRGSVIPGAGMGQKGAGHHNQQAGCRPPTQGRQVVPLHVSIFVGWKCSGDTKEPVCMLQETA